MQKIFELFLGEIFEKIFQGTTGVPKGVFKNISESFSGNMSLEKASGEIPKGIDGRIP